MLSFVDTAGEDLNNQETAFTLQYLSVCDALIITLDPFALPGARARLNLPEDAIQVDDDVPLDVVAHITEMLRTEHNIKKRKRSPSRSRSCSPRSTRSTRRSTGRTRSWRRHRPCPPTTMRTARPCTSTCWPCCTSGTPQDIDTHMRLNYTDYRYFGVSALGAEPDYESGDGGAGRGAAAPGRGPGAVAAVQGGDGAVDMTADAFDRLLYTDCRAGTGRGGGGGFQVQAQSAGVDSAQSKLAVGWLLYEVQNAWIVQRRPVEDFPLGFAHASGAGYGTAQSRYIGKEATGGRQGNHLADCLLTREPDLYGADPAGAAVAVAAVAGRALGHAGLPAVPADDLEPGPLTVNAVADWVRERPERAPVLSQAAQRAGGPGRQARGDRGRRSGRGADLDRRGDPAAAGAGTRSTSRSRSSARTRCAPSSASSRARRTQPAARAGPRRSQAFVLDASGVQPPTTPRSATGRPSSSASWPQMATPTTSSTPSNWPR